ncbi:hypothetical protein AMTRI_Chr03g144370 [Amborella trichopoda]
MDRSDIGSRYGSKFWTRKVRSGSKTWSQILFGSRSNRTQPVDLDLTCCHPYFLFFLCRKEVFKEVLSCLVSLFLCLFYGKVAIIMVSGKVFSQPFPSLVI